MISMSSGNGNSLLLGWRGHFLHADKLHKYKYNCIYIYVNYLHRLVLLFTLSIAML